jgi:hypothetical protein
MAATVCARVGVDSPRGPRNRTSTPSETTAIKAAAVNQDLHKTFQQRLLRRVFGIVAVAQHAQADREHPTRVGSDQNAISRLVAVTARGDQLLFRINAQQKLLIPVSPYMTSAGPRS